MPEQPFKRISVIGLGYIGLPTAAMFASRKIEVLGVDVNHSAVETINRGEIHIVEPDLDMVVHAAVHEGYLRATVTPEPADAFLIAVPTPFKGDEYEPDLSYIAAASRAIAPVLQSGNIVILESTSPVGATEAMAGWLASERPDLSFPQAVGEDSDILIAHCPERVLPGKVMQELVTNDRIIGGMTCRCSNRAIQLYRTFVTGECLIASSPRVAEMAKLAENSFRDINIAFANELSVVCDRLCIDPWELIRLANRHPRVNILKPGPGVGGHCIAVDPWFIVASDRNNARLIRTARETNDRKTLWVVDQILKKYHSYVESARNATESPRPVVFYGLTFKPNIDDLRESPALKVVEAVSSSVDSKLYVIEPNIDSVPSEISGKVELIDLNKSGEKEGLHVFLVAHNEFAEYRKSLSGEILDFVGLG